MARLNGIDEDCSPSCQDCCRIAIILIDRGLSDNADFSNYSGMGRGSWSPNYGA